MVEPTSDALLSALRQASADDFKYLGAGMAVGHIKSLIARLDAAEKERDAAILAYNAMIVKCGELKDRAEFSFMEYADE